MLRNHAFPLNPISMRRISIILALLAATLAGRAVTSVALTINEALIIAICGVIILPLTIRYHSGALDVFEPLVPASLAFLVFFFARPLYDMKSGGLKWVSVDVADTYTHALVLVLISVSAFGFGYLSNVGVRLAKKLYRLPTEIHPDTAVVLSAILTAMAVTALTIKLLLMGGLTTVFSNRGSISFETSRNVPIISESVLIALPAFLILWVIPGQGRLVYRLLSLLPLSVVLLVSVPSGNRRFLFPLVIAIYALHYLRRYQRPSKITLLVLLLVAVFGLIIPIRTARTGQTGFTETVVGSVMHPTTALEDMIASQDTSMVSAVALGLQSVGSDRDIGWRYGMSFLTETLLQPIPDQLWSGKPDPIRVQIIEERWGMVNGRCTAMCPTFSVVTSFYSDFGWVSVVLGGLGMGVLFRTMYEYYQIGKQSEFVQAAYSATLFLPILVWWSSLSEFFVRLVILVVPILAVGWIAGKRSQAVP